MKTVYFHSREKQTLTLYFWGTRCLKERVPCDYLFHILQNVWIPNDIFTLELGYQFFFFLLWCEMFDKLHINTSNKEYGASWDTQMFWMGLPKRKKKCGTDSWECGWKPNCISSPLWNLCGIYSNYRLSFEENSICIHSHNNWILPQNTNRRPKYTHKLRTYQKIVLCSVKAYFFLSILLWFI